MAWGEFATPRPVNKHVVCSVCGLDWERHGKNPTTEKCVELLKADLASEKLRTTPQPAMPYPVPYPYPVRPHTPYPGTNPFPARPLWTINPLTTTSGSLSTGSISSPPTSH